MYNKVAWNQYDAAEKVELNTFAQEYKQFLDHGKTERECVTEGVKLLESRGFISLDKAGTLKPGDRVYVEWMHKDLMAFVIGKRPLSDGMNILGAHIDSPRIDVKQNPVYEDDGIAYLDMHYYGGIKKYQWVAQPLALHGVIVRKDGTKVTLALGEDDADPVFYISDLLIHLAQEQMEKKAGKVIEGEELNLIIGSEPASGEEKEAVKKALLTLLKDEYGIFAVRGPRGIPNSLSQALKK